MPARRNKPAAKVLTRALEATPQQVDAYPADYHDLAIAQSLLLPDDRALTWAGIAAEVGLDEPALRKRLLDPVRCAWISRQLQAAVAQRIGMVDAAVFVNALRTGDPSRARYLRDHYAPAEKQPERHMHLHASIDLSQLSEEELRTFISDRRRALNMGSKED